MFGFKRLKYRQSVETSLSYLILFDEPYLQKLLRSFDGITGVINTACDEGREPMEFAVELWGIMFAYEIERSPQLTDDAERVIEFLTKGGSHRYDTETAMGCFINQADKQVGIGRVSSIVLDIAIDEIIGALRGIDRQERAARRIARHLEEAFLDKQAEVRSSHSEP